MYCVGLSEDWQQIKEESAENRGGMVLIGGTRYPQHVASTMINDLISELQNAPVCFLHGPFRSGLYRRGVPCRS